MVVAAAAPVVDAASVVVVAVVATTVVVVAPANSVTIFEKNGLLVSYSWPKYLPSPFVQSMLSLSKFGTIHRVFCESLEGLICLISKDLC